MKYKPSLIYLSSFSFILTWWWLFEPVPNNSPKISKGDFQYSVENASYLEPINRDDLLCALRGDYRKMIELLTAWDLEASSLPIHGLERLSAEEFREAIHLYYALSNKPTEKVKIIPQTHLAATVLLSIAPESLVALPMGIRMNNDLFLTPLFNQIPLNCQHLEGELLNSLSPHVAFVAPYSNPVFLKMLDSQQVPQVLSEATSTIDELFETIEEIAYFVKKPHEGRLLSLFVKGSFMAVDNRLKSLMDTLNLDDLGKIVFLFGNDQYYTPCQNSLTFHLLERLGVKTPTDFDTSKPIMLEEIESFDPDLIILASDMNPTMKTNRSSIYLVNPTVQDSPTQFAALAYRDIASCIMEYKLKHE